MWLGLSLWLLGYLLTQPASPNQAWLYLLVISHVAVGEIRRVLLEQASAEPVKRANVSVA